MLGSSLVVPLITYRAEMIHVKFVEAQSFHVEMVSKLGDCTTQIPGDPKVPPTDFKAISVTGQRYVALLQNNIIPELQARQTLQTVTFMQDVAPPHIALLVQLLLRSTFGKNRIISRCFNHVWPPRSPDLTPGDFKLWIFLKSKVYCDQPASLTALKDAIRQNVYAITQEMLVNAVNDVVTRLIVVLLSDRQHIEHLL
ncbi:uncharacterized protein TNCV_1778051 [Trichonephila clavipes]|nr:uncharacterized protein TNCV_1778051 [Trichonephila clavipes]